MTDLHAKCLTAGIVTFLLCITSLGITHTIVQGRYDVARLALELAKMEKR